MVIGRLHHHNTCMRMLRTWAVYYVELGYPILVQRFPSRAEAEKIAQPNALHVVEHLMPDGPRLSAGVRGHNDNAGEP